MAVLDEEALLAVCESIDLNPVAAGVVPVPEASPHQSMRTRVEHVQEQGRSSDLAAATCGSMAGSCASEGLEELFWLCPIEDRRQFDSSREGMLEGFSLGSYRLLVGDSEAPGPHSNRQTCRLDHSLRQKIVTAHRSSAAARASQWPKR